jgi:hypothetical protein
MNYRLGRFLKIPVRKAISGPIVFVDFPPAPNLTCAACVGHRLSNRPTLAGNFCQRVKGIESDALRREIYAGCTVTRRF